MNAESLLLQLLRPGEARCREAGLLVNSARERPRPQFLSGAVPEQKWVHFGGDLENLNRQRAPSSRPVFRTQLARDSVIGVEVRCLKIKFISGNNYVSIRIAPDEDWR
jgi:hypothetical protein